MNIKILNRFTGAVLFEGEYESLRACVEDAVRRNVSLDGASLNGASLDGASLNGASLDRASLNDAWLDGASLNGAWLDGASLNGASLDGALLDGASLNGASLDGAYLENAKGLPSDIPRTGPSEPYVRKPSAAAREQRMLLFRERNPDVPVVEHLDAKILAAVSDGVGKLDMSEWHKCQTTHCRAGWAIALAGDEGRQLEERVGPQRAGIMIYRASTGRVPHFFASTERALEDIKACAATAEDAS
jgi:hypothetical protein